jgi:hypothetical protein
MDDWHDGLDWKEWQFGDKLPKERRWWASLPFRLVLAALGLSLAYGLALAAAGQPTNCSQTVGASAAAVVFPAGGSTGNPSPQTHLEICNAHATNTLGVNWSGGAASIGAAGTLTLNPGGCISWGVSSPIIPQTVSVIGSAGSTVTACGYN